MIAAVLRELIAAGLMGEELIAAVTRIESAYKTEHLQNDETPRQARNRRYYTKRLNASEKRLNASYSDDPSPPSSPPSLPSLILSPITTSPSSPTPSSLRSESIKPQARPDDDWPKNFSEQAWQRFPRKVGRKAAIRKIETIRKSGEISFAAFIAAIDRHAAAMAATDEKFRPHPTTWLNEGRYLDETPAPANMSTGPPPWLTPEQRVDWSGGWRPGMPSSAELKARKNGQTKADAGTHSGGGDRPRDQGDLLAADAPLRQTEQHR